jgi:hypothetical protein
MNLITCYRNSFEYDVHEQHRNNISYELAVIAHVPLKSQRLGLGLLLLAPSIQAALYGIWISFTFLGEETSPL